MKKTFLFSTALLLAVGSFTSSCDKYAGGPGISLRSKKARLTGDWKLNKITINDVQESFAGSQSISIKTDDTYTWNSTYVFFGQNSSTSGSGTWKFNDDKTKLIKTETGSTESDTIEIYKLTSKEIQFKSIYGNNIRIETYVPQ
jgi:hypothetical protein